ncbi:hypothetical protein GCM10009844_19030 [Nocardioides koreensis]|uniref:Cellulose synthase n=1 Tax=Nocardioides koreensis TaxID=433651 RepID=A0ABN2ZNI5_9ACTN
MDDVTWGAFALTLTLLGGIWTWYAFRRRGVASGLRAAAFTLLPMAAYLTRTLRLFTRVAGAIGDWAASLVFNPFVWVGFVLFGVSAGLFVVSGLLRARELGGRPEKKARRGKQLPPGGKGAPAIDDDMAEIEALLRKRGIS